MAIPDLTMSIPDLDPWQVRRESGFIYWRHWDDYGALVNALLLTFESVIFYLSRLNLLDLDQF